MFEPLFQRLSLSPVKQRNQVMVFQVIDGSGIGLPLADNHIIVPHFLYVRVVRNIESICPYLGCFCKGQFLHENHAVAPWVQTIIFINIHIKKCLFAADRGACNVRSYVACNFLLSIPHLGQRHRFLFDLINIWSVSLSSLWSQT